MRDSQMPAAESPTILTYRFHEFRPSDRKVLKQVLHEDGGKNLFIQALKIYLDKWSTADWLTEYDLERIAKWTAIHFPEVSAEVEDMAAKASKAAVTDQAKRTYDVMVKATHEQQQASV